MKYHLSNIFRHSYGSNGSYFMEYDDFEFEAENDEQAIEIVERIQHKCESAIKEDGNELEDGDPCLMACIEKLVKEEDDEWEAVEL